MKIIKINIQTHNKEDDYYTEYYTKYFYTNINDTNKIIELLKSLNIKQYENKEYHCYSITEIDEKDLINKMNSIGFKLIESDLIAYVNIKEDEGLSEYITVF